AKAESPQVSPPTPHPTSIPAPPVPDPHRRRDAVVQGPGAGLLRPLQPVPRASPPRCHLAALRPLVGNGHLLVLDLSAAGPGLTPLFSFPTSDALFDCAWSESHDSLCAAASGDGSVRLFDVTLPPAQNPVRLLREHAREVHGIDWNPVRRDAFLSASWDDTLKLWSPDRPASVRTFRGHEYCVYAAAWSARHPDVFASASGDHTARVWDVREPGPTLVIPAHDHEVLSLDWDKYDPSILATGSVDKSIRIWDVRSPQAPLAQLAGHGYAVKRVKFSPHRQGMLMSCSYDMTVCMWDYRKEDALLQRYGHHTEFVAGIDMSVLTDGLLASTGWDEMIYVWPFGSDPRAM
uniref:Peroxin-7 n=2 Tax=Aegilops tauschii subsp. strangulata TaxID=200361 RepID=A0A453G0W3_AEGTS